MTPETPVFHCKSSVSLPVIHLGLSLTLTMMLPPPCFIICTLFFPSFLSTSLYSPVKIFFSIMPFQIKDERVQQESILTQPLLRMGQISNFSAWFDPTPLLKYKFCGKIVVSRHFCSQVKSETSVPSINVTVITRLQTFSDTPTSAISIAS